MAVDEGNVGARAGQLGGDDGPDPFSTRDQGDSPVQLHMASMVAVASPVESGFRRP
jgi:hypothetical protein